MKTLVIYLHGKGGSAAEAEHYAPLFPDATVVGFGYQAKTPWGAVKEFQAFFDTVSDGYDAVYLIANSIGAYFALCALGEKPIRKAFFISPIVNMEKLISDMMIWANVTERELQEKKTIETSFGEVLSWDYLSWVRNHPVRWNIPTEILYGDQDHLQSFDTIRHFAGEHCAKVTVMENGEHWFHTDEQMQFLDGWIKERTKANGE
ncbi:MAG: alpha/beta hydrolase [Clostridiales bacterium]|nr:alpha/beta hydrolase [Candidatus Cacconaster stercorequi]